MTHLISPSRGVACGVALIMCLTITSLCAQTTTIERLWPDYASTTVNDYADLIGDAAEAELSQTLDTLRAETGVEMTVLTLDRKDTYTYGVVPPPTIEDFATGVFNQWGVGDAASNDGVLILVVRADREMRIELGGAYGQGWNAHAARVIDRSFLPAFREDRYEAGIIDGTQDTIDSLVRPFLDGAQPPSGGPEVGWLLVGGVLAFLFGRPAVGAVRNRLARCGQCGRRGQQHETTILSRATRAKGGRKRRVTTCPHCGHRDEMEFSTSRLRASSSSSFGGGSSGGGGATGRW